MEPPPEQQPSEVYLPEDVAKHLGISSAGLRRLAVIYERVYGELPRSPNRGRLWTGDAVERLESARLAVQQGRAVSVEAALAGLRAGAEPIEAQPAVTTTSPTTSSQPLGALVGELRALREAVEEQNRRLGALEEGDRSIWAALPPPVRSVRPLLGWLPFPPSVRSLWPPLGRLWRSLFRRLSMFDDPR